MPGEVDLYDNAYANYDAEVYRQIRVATHAQFVREGLQQFLSTVHALTSEKRLLRYVYVAVKPGESSASS
jgi:hypothetical protein